MTGPGTSARRTVAVLLASAAGAGVLTLLRLPAGALIGAVVGAAAVNRVRPTQGVRPIPVSVRVTGLVLLGCVAGARLDLSTLEALARMALPLLAAVVGLLVLDFVLAWVLVRHYNVDALTAVMACAPGGVSEIALTAEGTGARMGVVLAIHGVRVLVVVTVVLPLLLIWVAER